MRLKARVGKAESQIMAEYSQEYTEPRPLSSEEIGLLKALREADHEA